MHTPEQYFAIVPYVMYNMEQPLGDASAIVFALGCQATAKHTKLCYSGEGADEFFGGYNMYRNAERYGENLKTFYVGNTNIMKEEEKKKILKRYRPDVLPIELAAGIYGEETERLGPLTKMSDVDIQIWLEGDIYLNVDKMSEAAGLEIRMPLTDLFESLISHQECRQDIKSTKNRIKLHSALPQEKCFRRKSHSARSLALSYQSESGWQMTATIRMCARNSTARWRQNSSILMRSMRSLMIMLTEIRITGEKCGQFIHSLCGMRNTL